MNSMNKSFQKVSRVQHLLTVMASQAASTYSNQVISFVIPWLVLTRTGNAMDAGTVAFAMGIAGLLGTLSGGLVTDRIGGRKVSIIADGLSLITAFILALTLFFDFFALWLVVVSQVLGVFFDGPGMIAKNTMIPVAAKEDDIPMVRAMGLQNTLQNMAMFIGPVSAGFLIAFFTESITLMITSILFMVAILLIASQKRQTIIHEHPMTIRQAYRDMHEAVIFIVKEPFLGPMQVFGSLYAFVLLPLTTIVFPAWFIFAKQSSEALGIFLGANAIGGMIGGFIFAAFAPKVSQQKWLFWATVGYALALLAFYFLQPGSIHSVIVGFLGGLVFTGVMAIPYTAFFTRTPEKLMGRVGSLGAASGFLVASLASLFFGWLVNSVSAPTTILVCAFIMGAIALGVLCLPFMKYLDEKK